jgi:hypothetical protein
MVAGTDAADGGSLTPVINYQVPLARIVDSVIGLDKDQYFGDSVYLRIVWAAANQVLSFGTSVTDPSAGVTPYAGNLTISNLNLYLAIEQDATISQALMDKCKNGSLEYIVPYVYGNKQGLNTTSQSISVRYNLAHGRKLKKLLWSPFNNTERSTTMFDNSNTASSKVVSFYTMLNNTRTSQFNYTCANGDDYMDKKSQLKGSCILSSNEYYYNYVHCEDFTGLPSTSASSTDNIDSGYDLTTAELKYDIVATTADVTNNHYIFAITVKKLSCSPTGITLL